jgi:hypothetical protein
MSLTADAGTTRDVYTDAGELRGVWVRGGEPKELVLSDGSRLSITDGERGRVRWERHGGPDGNGGSMSVDRAAELAGDEFADYVRVRTRAEAEWLRAVADWCASEADRLASELGESDARSAP